MARDIIAHELKDWSQITSDEELWSEIDLSHPQRNFGIHSYGGQLWTSGYVGVGRLYNKRQKPICSGGKEHILIVKSQYRLDPWKMLEAVMADEEYEDYLSELPENEALFQVFYDQPLIRLAQDGQNDGDLLYAISFINSCYSLCKKGLKKDLIRQEGNYPSKVRGKINVKRNIRENTCRGRNDRFCCQYIDFTEDTLENRILKSALEKCRAILKNRFQISAPLASRIGLCMNALRRVKTAAIKASDFACVTASGLYMYYKPVLRQAKSILSQKYHSYAAENGETVTKSVYTVPYMVNMEKLFEFYARTVIKRLLAGSGYCLDRYSRRLFLQHGVSQPDEAERGIHLMAYCIPDILICRKDTNEPVFVLDAKYKSHARSTRADTHQLLSYVLLTNVKRCGFVFPGENTALKTMGSGEDHLLLAGGDLRYYELLLGHDSSADAFRQLVQDWQLEA